MAARSMQTKDPGTDESGPGKRDNNSTEPFATSIYFFSSLSFAPVVASTAHQRDDDGI